MSDDNYDRLIKEIKENHKSKAKEYIPRLCHALKAENPNLSHEDIKECIKKDLIDIWSRTTIYEHLPEDLKDQTKQEAGKKSHKNDVERSATEIGPENQILSVTTDGSIAQPRELNNESPGSEQAPKSNTFEKPVDWEAEKKRIYESNHTDHSDEKDGIIKDQKVEIDKLKESLKEEREQTAELLKSVNSAAQLKKNIAVADSLEYKALESQLYVLQTENKELKQIAQMQMKQNPSDTFKQASEIKQDSPSPSQTGTIEVEFPAKDLSTLWLDAKNAKQAIYFKIVDGKVVGWESDYARAKNQSRKQAQPA